MKKLLLVLVTALSLGMVSCGGDDEDLGCNGLENRERDLNGAELLGFGGVVDQADIDLEGDYDISVSAAPECTFTGTGPDGGQITGFIQVADGGDGSGAPTTPTDLVVTAQGSLSAGAQGASAASSIDIDTWTTFSNATGQTALPNNINSVDLVFINDGGILKFVTPLQMRALNLPNFQVYVTGNINTVTTILGAGTPGDPTATGFEVPTGALQEIAITGQESFYVRTSNGRIAKIDVTSVQNPGADNALVTFAGWIEQ